MAEKKVNKVPEKAKQLKNPSPIGTQQNPVSNPDAPKDPVAKELEEREAFQKEHGPKEEHGPKDGTE